MKIPCEGTWAIPAWSSFAFMGIGGMTELAIRQPQVFGSPENTNSAMVVDSNWNHLGEEDVEILVAS